MRYRLDISYDGTNFDGWQTQTSGRGIQDAVERAFIKLGEKTKVNGAGRTDSGVHARCQTAHCDLAKIWEPRRLTLALNAHLPDSIEVIKTSKVDDSFDARRSALKREYRYFIWLNRTCYPFIKPYVMECSYKLDTDMAAKAAKLMIGEHDFRSYCRTTDAPDNTYRTIYRSDIHKCGDLVIYRIIGSGFLTNMVRIIVGNITAVASGRKDMIWLEDLFTELDRSRSAITAPAKGLFFWRADY